MRGEDGHTGSVREEILDVPGVGVQVPTTYWQITNLCEPVLMLWCGSLSRKGPDRPVWSRWEGGKWIFGEAAAGCHYLCWSSTSCVALTLLYMWLLNPTEQNPRGKINKDFHLKTKRWLTQTKDECMYSYVSGIHQTQLLSEMFSRCLT